MALKALFYPDVKFETLYIPYIYKEIYIDGVYVDIFNQKKDMVVMDVGANIGVVTQYMRDYAKKLYAIEPSPEHFEALKKNKEFNNWDNVEIFNVAFADKDGETELGINEGNRTMNSIIIGEITPDNKYLLKGGKYTMEAYAPYKEKIKVKTLAFDTFMEENKIDSVDFVKFDVEMAEDLILRSPGFRKIANRIKAIEVEMHFPDWRELVDYMIELGFTARQYNTSAIIILFTR